MYKFLLKILGVDKLVKSAFYEGWKMHAETDRRRGLRTQGMNKEEINAIIETSRVWRSADEAWSNSEAEEMQVISDELL